MPGSDTRNENSSHKQHLKTDARAEPPQELAGQPQHYPPWVPDGTNPARPYGVELYLALHSHQHGYQLEHQRYDLPFAYASGRAGDLTNFLMRLIICCLLENYWVSPFPGASFGINHFFSYIAQAMVAAFDQNSLDSLLQLLKTAGDNTAMPSLMAPVQILCFFLVQILLGLASAILFLINCSAFIVYGVTALFGPIFVPLLMKPGVPPALPGRQ